MATNRATRPAVDINDSIAYVVYRSARLLRTHFLRMAAAAGFELTPEQWFVLNKLSWHDGQSQIELCDAIFRERPNITRILGTMEQRGLVRRRVDGDDARKMRVFITATGRRLHDGFSALARDVRADLFGGIPARDLQTTIRVLRTLEDRLA